MNQYFIEFTFLDTVGLILRNSGFGRIIRNAAETYSLKHIRVLSNHILPAHCWLFEIQHRSIPLESGAVTT